MKKHIKLILLFSLFLVISALVCPSIMPSSARFAFYPYQMHAAVDAIAELPEACELLGQVQKKGRVGIASHQIPGADFMAYWDGSKRVIILNPDKNERVDTQISSILFELHNAAADEQFARLANEVKRGEIDKYTYVRKMEWIEHQNTLKAGKLIKLGQERGIFPQSIVWRFSGDFEYHFQRQLETGHAGWHARNYDLLVG